MKNILVIGASGPQGRPVAEQLTAAGFKVRAMVRDPAKVEDANCPFFPDSVLP